MATLLEFRMDCHANEHAYAYFTGIVSEETNWDDLLSELQGSVVSAFSGEDVNPVFSGVILDAGITNVNGYYEVAAKLVSGTYLLDIQRKKRSFQDVNMTYGDLVKIVLQDTPTADCILTVGADTPIGMPIIQYMETDWEFIRRLASHFNTSLIPELAEGKPKFWFGMRESATVWKFSETTYSVNISRRYYELGGSIAGYSRSDFMYYCVEDREDYPLGDHVLFKEQETIICAKSCRLINSMLVFTYHLGTPKLINQKKAYNQRICGMSILGTVLETAGEKLKIHLDIDESQEKEKAYPYKWVPTTGNLLYLMPKVGTRVSLYCSDEDETGAKAINCVRTNGGDQCPNMGDYNSRYLKSEHGRQLSLLPESMGLQRIAQAPPLFAVMDDQEGITFQSDKKIQISATEKIAFEAPDVIMKAQSEIVTSRVNGANSNVPYNTLADPAASLVMSLSNRVDALGKNSLYAGWKFTSYPAFADAPKEGKFEWGKFALNILAGIAVVAAVAVVGALTFGAGVAIGAALVGGMYVGMQAMKDYQSGNVSDMGTYIKEALIGSVIGAVSGGVAPALGFWGTVGVGALMGGGTNALEQGIRNAIRWANGEPMEPFDWKAFAFSTAMGGVGGGIGYGVGKAISKAAPALKGIFSSADDVVDDVARVAGSEADDIARAGAGAADDVAKAGAGAADDVTKAGAGAADDAARVGSKLEEVCDLADNYKLDQAQFDEHILARHGPESTYSGKSKFDTGFDIKQGIDDTLRSQDSVIKPNTQGRDGYIFEHTYDHPIGTSPKGAPLSTVKVVIDESGNVVTAFPKKP